MALKDLQENKLIGQQLERMLKSSKMVHAIIFAGGSEESRFNLANNFAEDLIEGNLADLTILEKPEDRQTIVVDQIDELARTLSFKPVGQRHVVIIKNAQQMSTIVQNKFLKNLEEPNSEAVIMLLTDKVDELLPTVKSRCTAFYLEDAKEEENPALAKAAESLIRLSLEKSTFYKKKAALEPILSNKDEVRVLGLEFLNIYEDRLRTLLLFSVENNKKYTECIDKNLKACTYARKCLESLHNPSYTLKQMCLMI